jgi:hypothetical protein
MRDNGVLDYPDPGDDGVMRYQGDTTSPVFIAAKEKCRHLRPTQ